MLFVFSCACLSFQNKCAALIFTLVSSPPDPGSLERGQSGCSAPTPAHSPSAWSGCWGGLSPAERCPGPHCTPAAPSSDGKPWTKKWPNNQFLLSYVLLRQPFPSARCSPPPAGPSGCSGPSAAQPVAPCWCAGPPAGPSWSAPCSRPAASAAPPQTVWTLPSSPPSEREAPTLMTEPLVHQPNQKTAKTDSVTSLVIFSRARSSSLFCSSRSVLPLLSASLSRSRSSSRRLSSSLSLARRDAALLLSSSWDFRERLSSSNVSIVSSASEPREALECNFVCKGGERQAQVLKTPGLAFSAFVEM